MPRRPGAGWRCLALCFLAALVLAGCASDGEDDGQSPATAAPTSPTVPATAPSVASPGAVPATSPRPASPVASPAGRRPRAATPTEAAPTPAASPARRGTPSAAAGATPAARRGVVRRGATPGTPEQARAAEPPPPEIVDCEVSAELPAVEGGDTGVTTDSQILVRAAPGTGCEVLGQLDEGAELAILSGPVSADGFLWIRVSTADLEGWVAQDFVDVGAA